MAETVLAGTGGSPIPFEVLGETARDPYPMCPREPLAQGNRVPVLFRFELNSLENRGLGVKIQSGTGNVETGG